MAMSVNVVASPGGTNWMTTTTGKAARPLMNKELSDLLTARDRIRRDAELFKWSRQADRYSTELYLRGSRAIEVDYRRDGSVERAKWYPDFRGKYCEHTPAKRKKETVLAWLAE